MSKNIVMMEVFSKHKYHIYWIHMSFILLDIDSVSHFLSLLEHTSTIDGWPLRVFWHECGNHHNQSVRRPWFWRAVELWSCYKGQIYEVSSVWFNFTRGEEDLNGVALIQTEGLKVDCGNIRLERRIFSQWQWYTETKMLTKEREKSIMNQRNYIYCENKVWRSKCKSKSWNWVKAKRNRGLCQRSQITSLKVIEAKY